MVLPLVKLGSLAFRTLSKPIAARLKHNAGIHPKFRGVIIGIAQVAGAAIIYEVQRSARSEARKEELRRQEVEAIKKRGEALAIEVQVMKQRISDMEQQLMKRRISEIEQQYAKWSLPGFRVFSFSTGQATPQPAGTRQPTAA
ncbi:hypothetical protein PR202_gb04727 [Eleusine coracana subsp. coracana]|uniref:Uncharacterized protein n=1 Tax=Eleusine coracana subsp. coracana TaxID=191504 RepID=A0AAV5E4J5_ELECO|nr:hypothetical protein PR202_gb04727 [Eleusine coracana subsp. coracana]